MAISDIKGQDIPLQLLQRAIANNRIANSYLFFGPPGVGKELIAKWFAKAVNCEEHDGDSCDTCISCKKIDKNYHPDVICVSPMARSRKIKIEQIRDLQRVVSLKPYEADYKVVIIIEAHTLTQEAGNALLKTLEEPPSNTILILVTHVPEALLPTIRSRVQEVQFYLLDRLIVEELLNEKMETTEEKAKLHSRMSLGSMERATALSDENISERRKMLLNTLANQEHKSADFLTSVVEDLTEGLKDYKDSLEKKLGENLNEGEFEKDENAYIAGQYRAQVDESFNIISSWFRDILVYKNTQDVEKLYNADYEREIIEWSEKINTDKLCDYIDVVEDIKEGLNRNLNLKLLYQALFVKLSM